MTAALKLTTYFGERDRVDGRLLADELLDIYDRHHLQASLLLRGGEGFGRLHHLHTDRLLSLSEDLPVVSIALDTAPRIETVLEVVLEVKRRGLITLERADLLTGELTHLERPVAAHAETKLTVYLGRQDRVGREPAFVALCDLLRRRGIAGATVMLGVDGSRHGHRARAEFFGRNADVPMTVVAVGATPSITSLLPEIAGLLREPLLSLEAVRICKRDGALLARPDVPPPTGTPAGGAAWQKLTVYTSQSALHEGRPVHLEIIRRLRATHAAGATSLRGIWGFHGDHAPHGDRLIQLRRRVPVVTIILDTPERIARSFEIVDELTREVGLVTSEAVPAMLAISRDQRVGGLQLPPLPD